MWHVKSRMHALGDVVDLWHRTGAKGTNHGCHGKKGCQPFHIQAALNVGCTEPEVAEVISTVALYAGIPAALNGLRTAANVFEENSQANEL